MTSYKKRSASFIPETGFTSKFLQRRRRLERDYRFATANYVADCILAAKRGFLAVDPRTGQEVKPEPPVLR